MLSFPVVLGTAFPVVPGSVSESAVIVPGSASTVPVSAMSVPGNASTVPVSGVTVHLFP